MSNHAPAFPPLLSLLSRATEHERRALVAELAERGFDDVGLAGARLLARLADGPASIQALAAASGTTKQFAAREVKKLERAGYVSVAASPNDGRATSVTLARRGRRLLEESRQVKLALTARVKRRLGARALATLERLLVALTATPSDAEARRRAR
jgi:DNA-binding MarR family transcriptional regulator